MKSGSLRPSLVAVLLPLILIIGLVLLLSLEGAQTISEPNLENPLEAILKSVFSYLSVAVEIAATTVVFGAVLRGIIAYLQLTFNHPQRHFNATELIRLQLGRGLALGLEFTIASDILRTIIAPTRNDIINLGAIVLLRTLLTYFLEQEIQQVEKAEQRNLENVGSRIRE